MQRSPSAICHFEDPGTARLVVITAPASVNSQELEQFSLDWLTEDPEISHTTSTRFKEPFEVYQKMKITANFIAFSETAAWWSENKQLVIITKSMKLLVEEFELCSQENGCKRLHNIVA